MSLWSTIEADSWARGFDYENYCSFHSKYSYGRPLTETSYKLFCQALDKDMEECSEKLEGGVEEWALS